MEPGQAYLTLHKAFGPRGWWPVTVDARAGAVYRPGFQGPLSERQRAEVCFGAILTQNTNWKNVESALARLHGAGIRDCRALARIPARRLETLIRASGYFRQKSKKLKIFARHVVSRGKTLGAWLSGPLPELREELLSLWGVGRETADSILLYAGARPVFVVDAYTVRIGRRLGWFRRLEYDHVQRFFAARLPEEVGVFSEFHALLVELAKRYCRVTPVCGECPLREVCRHARSVQAAA